MKTKEEKIIRYIDQQMDADEKIMFEEELKSSPALRNEVEKSKKILASFRDEVNIPLDNYFNNLFAAAENKKEEKRGISYKPAAAFALAASIIFVLFLLIFRQDDNVQQEYKNIITSLNEDEILYFMNGSSSEFVSSNPERFDSVLTDIIAEELSAGDPDLNYLVGNKENYKSITREDAELVYSEIINKKFF